MPRKKIAELKAKELVLGSGEVEPETGKKYVVKVDQGVKKRGKLGLLKLNLDKSEIETAKGELAEKGYDRFIVEEFIPHSEESEKYLAITLTRSGWQVLYSEKGGIEVEDHTESMKEKVLALSLSEDERAQELAEVAEVLGVEVNYIQQIIKNMESNFISFLEINPLVVMDSADPIALDMALEVDSVGSYFVAGNWSDTDFVTPPDTKVTEEEVQVAALADKSQASLALKVLNPDGGIWMLLSGGGASIVLADEVYNQGHGTDLANYGEYSGNPKASETYEYTKQVLSLLLKSGSKSKVLIIAGGVANFTDVGKTFAGVIMALQEYAEKLREQKVKIFVRRGGPRQAEGLKQMEDFLRKEGLYGFVTGPDLPLTDIVTKAISSWK